MKPKIFIAIALITFLAVSSICGAQTRTKTIASVPQGQYIDFGGTNLTPSDSLQVTDSLAYIIPIDHVNEVFPYLTFLWNKIGSGTATLQVNFFQSNDPTNFYPVKAGVAQTTYSKTFTLSASAANEISFQRDTAQFYGRYLKVQFITSATASVKGKLFNRLKTYFR
jgi:hypothetical protein